MSASQVQNPNLSAAVGPTFNYNASAPGCSGCQSFSASWSLADNNAIVDFLVGKRSLRIKGAAAALRAARSSRADAERTLTATLKQQFMAVVLARASRDFAVEVNQTMVETLELMRKRYTAGATDEGSLARVDVQKLEADQVADATNQALRQAQVALAFLLGARGPVGDFEVEKTLLHFEVPPPLRDATVDSLLETALSRRPDLAAFDYLRQQAGAQLQLARRQVFPDVGVYVNYSQLGVGQNVGQPMSAIFGLSLNLPVFYQMQGEIRRARGVLAQQSLLEARGRAQVIGDVSTAWAAFVAQRQIVERMERELLGQARTARDIVRLQFSKGSATLMDYLDAERTFIAANQEYYQDLANYWTAVFQLEQAVGGRLLP